MDELPKEFEFFASLVEQYAASRGTTADKVITIGLRVVHASSAYCEKVAPSSRLLEV